MYYLHEDKIIEESKSKQELFDLADREITYGGESNYYITNDKGEKVSEK